MYREFFGFKEKPFALSPDPKYLFLSESHRGALDHMTYGITQREGFISITGDVGTGKTTICRTLIGRLDPSIRTALILNPVLDGSELLQTILQDFGIQTNGKASRKELLDLLNAHLLDWAGRGENALLIIDEAQALSAHTLEQIRLLSNLETEKEKLLQIILVGQPELKTILESHALRQLSQRISVRYHLRALSAKETKQYIYHRLTVAGSSGSVTFTDGAVREVYRFSKGVPRLINLACDRALLRAFVEQEMRVTRTMVRIGLRSLREEEESAPSPSKRRHRVAAPAALVAAVLVAVILIANQFGIDAKKTWRLLVSSSSPPVSQPSRSSPSEPPAQATAPQAESPQSVPSAPAQSSSEEKVPVPDLGTASYALILGTYESEPPAMAQIQRLKSAGYTPALIIVKRQEGGRMYRVVLAGFGDSRQAEIVEKRLRTEGQAGTITRVPYAEVFKENP